MGAFFIGTIASRREKSPAPCAGPENLLYADVTTRFFKSGRSNIEL
jgi:hypothetical protein